MAYATAVARCAVASLVGCALSLVLQADAYALALGSVTVWDRRYQCWVLIVCFAVSCHRAVQCYFLVICLFLACLLACYVI